MTRYLNAYTIMGWAVSLALIWYMFTKIAPAGVSLNGSLLLFIGIAAACAIVVGGELLITKWTLTGAAVNVARGVSILFSSFIALFTVVSIWSWGVPQGLPNFGWMGQIMLHIWQIVIWMTAACIVYAIGETFIRKTVPVGNGRAIARIVIAILALTFASAITASTVNQGLWSFGWVGNPFTAVTLSWSTSIVVLTGILLLIMAVYGAYRDAKTAGDRLAILAWRTLLVVLIVLTALILSVGAGGVTDIGNWWQTWSQSNLHAFLTGQPMSFTINWGKVVLGVFGLFAIWAAWKFTGIRIMAAVIGALFWIPFITWLAWGSLSADFPELKVLSDKVSAAVTTGKFTTPEEDAAAFAAKREEDAAAAAKETADAKLAAELQGIKEAAAAKEAAKDAPLTPAAFTTKTFGTFTPLQIKSGERVGPINAYKNTCFYWGKSGMGMFFVYSRPDFKSEPVVAAFADSGYSIKEWGHRGKPVQLFLEAKQGDIQIELERREGSDACK